MTTEPDKTKTNVATFDERPLHLSAASAKDPARYRRAKAEANAAGVALVIDPPVFEPVAPVAGEIVIPKNASVAEYRKLKAEAIEKGVPYSVSLT
jgi:hypothetical protein